jgi:hypothetical protein
LTRRVRLFFCATQDAGDFDQDIGAQIKQCAGAW